MKAHVPMKCGGDCGRTLEPHELAWPNYGYCDACAHQAEEERSARLQYNPYSERWYDPNDINDDEV